MEIACVLMAHANPPIVKDTMEGIHANMTDKIILHVDAAGWEHFDGKDFSPAILSKGDYHGFFRSPYRNSVLGIKTAYEVWPDADWYCYTEYDCLFVSPTFKEDLEGSKAWCVGMNYRHRNFKTHFLSAILNAKFRVFHHFLGACMFLHHDFIEELYNRSFFTNFLKITENYAKGYFPTINAYAVEEFIWPTMARALGGKLKELVSYDGIFENGCRGKCQKYLIRYRPGVRIEEVTPATSIIHPNKSMDTLIRKHFRQKRLEG